MTNEKMNASQRLLDNPTMANALRVIEGVEESIDPPLTESERDRMAVRLLTEVDLWREMFGSEIFATIEREDGTEVTVQFGVKYYAAPDTGREREHGD